MTLERVKILVIFIVTLTLSCSKEEPDIERADTTSIAAMVNDSPISLITLNLYALGRIQKNAADLTSAEREAMLDELIRIRLLANTAETAGLANDLQVAAELKIQRDQILAQRMAASYLEQNPVSEAELRLAYDDNIDKLSGPQYKARHILLGSQEDALEVIEELDQGQNFEELAIERSTGPSGPNGGDLSWFAAETMVAPFATAVRSMKVGSYSAEPVETQFGFHVILLEDTRDQAPPGLDSVRAELTQFVSQEKIEEFVNSLRAAAEIVTDIAVLAN